MNRNSKIDYRNRPLLGITDESLKRLGDKICELSKAYPEAKEALQLVMCWAEEESLPF